jgi:acetylornithine deacetylase
LEIERRTVPGESAEHAMAEVTEILDRLRATDDRFSANARLMVAREPFEVDRSAAIVQMVSRAYETVTKSRPTYGGQTPWMDAAFLAQAGVETVVIGPAGAGAHADEEWVDVASVVTLAEILVQSARGCCGQQGR